MSTGYYTNKFKIENEIDLEVCTSVTYTTFTLEPTITDLKLIQLCFKTSSNNICPFPTVYTRFGKRKNDCFQFSRLQLSMIMTGAR